jgi:hypothetical protein
MLNTKKLTGNGSGGVRLPAPVLTKKYKNMRAIVNVKKGSEYARFNNLTYEVKEVLSTLVALKIPSKGNERIVDFAFNEIVIVDRKSVV